MSTPLLTEAIRQASDPTTVMRRVTEQALVLVPHADGASLELRVDTDTLEYTCAAGSLAPFIGLRLGLGTSLSGRSVVEGALQRCDDATTDPRVDRAACERTGVRSMLCVPLLGGGRPVAALKISSGEANAFDVRDELVLRELADFLSVTVSAAAEVARATAEVLQAHPDADGDGGLGVHAARFVANVMSPGLVEDVEAAARIQRILADGAYSTVLQPVFDLTTGSAVAAEALTRFAARPERPPDEWFAEAYTVGLGEQLEHAAVLAALGLLPRMHPEVQLAVNLGPTALRCERVEELFAAVPRGSTVVELTEHLPVADLPELRACLSVLRSAGVELAVDDTGTGYSSLSRIAELEPDVIKIDRALVRDIDVDPVRKALVAAIVRLAVDLGARVVAEGVERVDEALALLDLGVGFGQGYLLARPTPLASVRWTSAWSLAAG